jgi:hypothetical protein
VALFFQTLTADRVQLARDLIINLSEWLRGAVKDLLEEFL